MPFGERSHGKEGIYEYYMKVKATCNASLRIMLHYIRQSDDWFDRPPFVLLKQQAKKIKGGLIRHLVYNSLSLNV